MKHIAVAGFMLTLFVVMMVVFWAIYEATNSNPCKPFWGNRTGVVYSEKHTFRCWDGEIVDVVP